VVDEVGRSSVCRFDDNRIWAFRGVTCAMQSTKELADSIYWERVQKARRMSPEDKLLGGARLFDRSCGIMAAGIRSQFPDADERRVQEILRERLSLVRRLENRRRTTGEQR
jgi:hypothetical protein